MKTVSDKFHLVPILFAFFSLRDENYNSIWGTQSTKIIEVFLIREVSDILAFVLRCKKWRGKTAFINNRKNIITPKELGLV